MLRRTGTGRMGLMADTSVRLARVSDADEIARITVDSWRQRFDKVLPADVLDRLDAEEISMTWARSILNPPSRQYRTLVAVLPSHDAEIVVGHAAIGPCTDPDACDSEIEFIALEVDPAHHRQGHGSRLMAAAMDIASEAGATGAVVWTVVQDEARRAFLQSAGWAPDSAYRDLAIDPTDEHSPVIREVRLVTGLDSIPSAP